MRSIKLSCKATWYRTRRGHKVGWGWYLGFKKNYAVFLLGKRIEGELVTDNSNNAECGNATQNKCDCTNATVDKRGGHNNKDSVCNPARNIVITVCIL